MAGRPRQVGELCEQAGDGQCPITAWSLRSLHAAAVLLLHNCCTAQPAAQPLHCTAAALRSLCPQPLPQVLLVAVPSKEHRSFDRILPGRDDVYIIPQSSCEDGKLLRESDDGRYYSNANIMACLVLKPPDSDAFAAPMDSSLRVVCSTAYDAHEGMTNVRMAALADDERVSDELDSSVFPPRVLRCTATIARLP